MTMFKFKEKEEESPTVKYQEKYDIFEHRGILEALEAEMKPFGDFYRLCQSKGYITIKPRQNEVTFDFTVNPETVSYFTDYCAREKALSKRQEYFRRKQEEADKQRLLV